MVQKKNNTYKDGLFIPSRQLAAYSSLALSVLGAGFMGGYFLGKQHALEQMVTQIEQTAFSDQISASLCTFYDQKYDAPFLAETPIQLDDTSLHHVEPDTVYLHESNHTSDDTQSYETLSEKSTQWYAQLIGYGTRKAAEQFANKLHSSGIPVVVKERTSLTAQGKQRNWYQVITEPYTDRDALDELTQRIAHQEKIQGIQIVAC